MVWYGLWIKRRNIITCIIHTIYVGLTGMVEQLSVCDFFSSLWIFQENFNFILTCLVWNHAVAFDCSLKKKNSLQAVVIVVFTSKMKFKWNSTSQNPQKGRRASCHHSWPRASQTFTCIGIKRRTAVGLERAGDFGFSKAPRRCQCPWLAEHILSSKGVH